MASNKSTKDDRARLWTCIVYPTDGNPSAPDNWRDIIDAEHIAWAESPLHQFDTNPDGEVKKPHVHILLSYDGKKSYEQVKDLTDRLNAPRPEKCASARGMVRYFCHMDNPEKYQYPREEIISHGGFDAAEYLKPTSSSRYQLIREMMQYIDEQGIVEMADLLLYASSERFDDWFPLLCDNSAYVIGSFITSRRHRQDRETERHNERMQDYDLALRAAENGQEDGIA